MRAIREAAASGSGKVCRRVGRLSSGLSVLCTIRGPVEEQREILHYIGQDGASRPTGPLRF